MRISINYSAVLIILLLINRGVSVECICNYEYRMDKNNDVFIRQTVTYEIKENEPSRYDVSWKDCTFQTNNEHETKLQIKFKICQKYIYKPYYSKIECNENCEFSKKFSYNSKELADFKYHKKVFSVFCLTTADSTSKSFDISVKEVKDLPIDKDGKRGLGDTTSKT